LKCPLCNIEAKELKIARSYRAPFKRMSKEAISDLVIEIDNRQRIKTVKKKEQTKSPTRIGGHELDWVDNLTIKPSK
jgi:hypothetical protein